MGQEQGWAVVPGFGGIPVPVPQIPGIGTGTGTETRGTVGTGTKICGTVPVVKSLGTMDPDISGQESGTKKPRKFEKIRSIAPIKLNMFQSSLCQ